MDDHQITLKSKNNTNVVDNNEEDGGSMSKTPNIPKRCLNRILFILGNVTVEPCFILFSLAVGLFAISSHSLYIQKVCSVNLGYSRDVCEDIINHKHIQIQVQQQVSVLQGYNYMLQSVPSVMYALFVGSWSDKHGRKMLITFSCFGYMLSTAIFIVNAYFWDTFKAEYLMFEAIQDCTGGSVTLFLGCYSYISDITSVENRTKRMAYLDGLFPIFFFIGMFLSGFLRIKYGFVATFSLAFFTVGLSVLYSIFFLRNTHVDSKRHTHLSATQMPTVAIIENGETSNNVKPSYTRWTKLKDVSNIEHLKRAFKTTFRKRDHGGTTIILLSGVVFVIGLAVGYIKGTTFFLYSRKKFDLDEAQFGQLVAVFGFTGTFTQFVVLPFAINKLHVRDTSLAVAGLVGLILQLCIEAFADDYIWLYVGGFISFLNATTTSICRSVITRCASCDEIGAVFSILAVGQASIPVISGPLYGFIYKATVATNANTFLFVVMATAIVALALMSVVHFMMKKVDDKQLEGIVKEKVVPEDTPDESQHKVLDSPPGQYQIL